MNDWDRNNLNFIMSLDDHAFDQWVISLSDDDQAYALELIRRGRLEIMEQEQELLDTSDLTLARQALAQFRL